MMKTAGTSITLTSVTDAVAFALGTTTSFPALKYFCIYAAIGIMLDFWFQISLFTACLVWDEQRIMSKASAPIASHCCATICLLPSPATLRPPHGLDPLPASRYANSNSCAVLLLLHA